MSIISTRTDRYHQSGCVAASSMARLTARALFTDTDAWFIGFDPDITVGIWIGMDDKRKSLGSDEQGAKAALPIWMDIMQAYIAGRPQTDTPPQFQAPGNIVFMAVDKSTGSVLPQGGGGAITEAFIAGTEPGGISRAQVP